MRLSGSKDSGARPQHVNGLSICPSLGAFTHKICALDAGYAFLVYLGLLALLARQVESDTSRTPAGLSRISRWSFVAQAAADAISFVGVRFLAMPICFRNNIDARHLSISHSEFFRTISLRYRL